MKVLREKLPPAVKGAPFFTGKVSSEPLFQADAPGHTRGSTVTFEPGSRTAWHTHPLGQTLIVTAGAGLVQCWGGPVEKVKPGDVVLFGAGEKHWHGAQPNSAMTHISILETSGDKHVEWMEPVSDEQYRA